MLKTARKDLEKSGITVDEAEAAGMFSVESAREISPDLEGCPALVIAYNDPWEEDDITFKRDGEEIPFCRVRYYRPKSSIKVNQFTGNAKKLPKYGQPKNSGIAPYFPEIDDLDWVAIAADSTIPLMITEGEKKALRACLEGFDCIGLGGVHNFAGKDGFSPYLERIEWEERTVHLIYDSDAADKEEVQDAIERLTAELQRREARVFVIILPPGPGGSKVGLDDYFETEDADALEKLLEDAPEADLNPFNARVNYLLKEYGHMEDGNLAVRLNTADPSKGQVAIAGFREANKPYGVWDGKKFLNPADHWSISLKRTVITGLAYRPDKVFPTYTDDEGYTMKNYFKRSEHKKGVGDYKWFVTFIKGLLPNDAERAWFLDSLAYKIQYPYIPTPGVIFVDKLGGVGKGIVFDIAIRLLGPRNAALLDEDAVFGGSNLANYEGDWAARVLHCIEELPSRGEASQKEQHNTYNRIKKLIDPRERTKMMPVKYGRPIEVYVCATFLMGTNNDDAVPISANDRRLVVLTCGEKRRRPYYRKIAEQAKSLNNIAAVYHWLCERDLSEFDNTYAPETLAKATMIETTRYGSEVVVREWLGDLADKLGEPPPFLTTQMVLREVRGEDRKIFEGQSGTRYVNAALKEAGYIKPRGIDKPRVRIKYHGSGDGTPENILQHADAEYVAGDSTGIEEIKKSIVELDKVVRPSGRVGGGDKIKIADLRRILMSVVRKKR